MFTDISVSTDLNNKFNNHLKDNDIDLGKRNNLAYSSYYILTKSYFVL